MTWVYHTIPPRSASKSLAIATPKPAIQQLNKKHPPLHSPTKKKLRVQIHGTERTRKLPRALTRFMPTACTPCPQQQTHHAFPQRSSPTRHTSTASIVAGLKRSSKESITYTCLHSQSGSLIIIRHIDYFPSPCAPNRCRA